MRFIDSSAPKNNRIRQQTIVDEGFASPRAKTSFSLANLASLGDEIVAIYEKKD